MTVQAPGASRSFAKPVGAQARTQGQTGTMQLDETVASCNGHGLADFVSIEAEYFAHGENSSTGIWQAVEAGLKHFPELFAFHGLLRRLPF